MFDIRVFGTMRVHSADRMLGVADLPRVKPRQLLEIIVLARGAVLSKPAIAEALWAGAPPGHWRATLETYVAVLRRTLQPDVAGRDTVIRTVPGGYRLDADRVHLDLDDFDSLTTSAASASPAVALDRLERAVEMSEPDVLAHEPYADWTEWTRQDYRRRSVRAAMSGARVALELGALDRAVALATSAVLRDPLAEDGWQALIAAHGRQGRPAEAMRAYLSCRKALFDELGVDPGPSTRDALERALDDNRLAPATELPLGSRSIGPAHVARSLAIVRSAGGRRLLRVTPEDPMVSTPSAG